MCRKACRFESCPEHHLESVPAGDVRVGDPTGPRLFPVDRPRSGRVHRPMVPTVLIVDDEKHTREGLQQALADAGLRGNPATGRPLKRTRPWRLLESVSLHLASARDQLPPDFPSLRDLIRHPDLAAWLDVRIADRASVDGGWLEAVDSYTSEHLQMTPGVMLGSGLVPTVTAEVCRGVEELLRCLDRKSTRLNSSH